MRASTLRLPLLVAAWLAGCDVFLPPPCVADHDVPQPDTTLTWRRCPVGGCWNGSGCMGVPTLFTWAEAQQVCPSLDPGYRVPTREELIAARGGATRCSDSQWCSQAFGDDVGVYWYWSSTLCSAGEVCQSGDAWLVAFSGGSAYFRWMGMKAAVLCVRGESATDAGVVDAEPSDAPID